MRRRDRIDTDLLFRWFVGLGIAPSRPAQGRLAVHPGNGRLQSRPPAKIARRGGPVKAAMNRFPTEFINYGASRISSHCVQRQRQQRQQDNILEGYMIGGLGKVKR
jgi:hypothetical protein